MPRSIFAAADEFDECTRIVLGGTNPRVTTASSTQTTTS